MNKLLFLILFLLTTFSLDAALPQRQGLLLSTTDEALVKKIEKKLNEITTMQTEFTQHSKKAAGGTQISRGIFMLSRLPKESVKFRFEYAPPPRVMIIGTGNNIMYFDIDVDQKTPLDLRQTPAAFLAKKRISFSEDYIITQFKKGPTEIEIRVIQRTNPEAGHVDVRFKSSDLRILGWRIKDMQETETTIDLKSVIFGLKLNPNLFKVLSPETGGRPKSLYK